MIATALLALTYYKENRFEAARPLFARALEADPEEIAARPLYGWTLYSLGELDAAAAAFESLLERKPDYAPAHYALGMIALDRDDTGGARRRFETAVRLADAQADPVMEGRAHARLGDLHARLGDLPRAKAELERSLDLFPGDPEALFRLSRVLQQMGDEEGAARVRERYEAANVRGLNFVLYDALAGGASRSLRSDTQGKTFALALLRMMVEVPAEYASMKRPGEPPA